ncbi:MAG: ComEC family competence protein, partial [Flavobacteriaceae bacterium]|nr:ComEC family competence protein [Flavobacteriaceae bacterium]
MKFIHTTLFQIAVLLTLGTLAAHFLSFEEFKLHWLWIASAVLLFIWFIERNRLSISTYFGGVAFLILFGIGAVNYQIRQPYSRAQHYLHRITSDDYQYARLKIQRELKPDRFNSKYIAEVSMLDGVSSVGRILVYLPSETNSYFQVDEELVIYAAITPLAPPKNPYQFDYSNYLNHLGVYAEVRMDSLSIHSRSMRTSTLRGSALRFRAHLIQQLSHSGIPLDERAILQALVLGQKKDISEELLENYADAGAIHILAVSGLHVGILFLLLNFLTQWLLRIRGGRYLQSILIVSLLWGYAYITGGSPSVTRAVTMFSFLTFAQRIGRQS